MGGNLVDSVPYVGPKCSELQQRNYMKLIPELFLTDFEKSQYKRADYKVDYKTLKRLNIQNQY